MQTEIKTLKDVETFIEQLAGELEEFHPLTDFADYTHPETHMSRYSGEEAELRNRCLEQCYNATAKYTPDYFTYLLNLFKLERAELSRKRKNKLPRTLAFKALLNFI